MLQRGMRKTTTSRNAPFDEAVSFLRSLCMGAKSQSKRVCRVNVVLLGLQAGVSAHPGPARVLGSRERTRSGKSASPGHGTGFEKVSPVQDGTLNAPLVNGEQTTQMLLQLPVPLLARLLVKESSQMEPRRCTRRRLTQSQDLFVGRYFNLE